MSKKLRNVPHILEEFRQLDNGTLCSELCYEFLACIFFVLTELLIDVVHNPLRVVIFFLFSSLMQVQIQPFSLS